MLNLPDLICSGFWKEGHVQGIALDTQKGYLYFSFTTILLKTDLQGNPIGSVRRLAGHLGCITFDPDRRRVYGSLELKHDAIGQGIIQRTGWDPNAEDNFYLVSFDVDRITRMDMDAETDGIMRAVWLKDVVADYNATDPVSGKFHRYGCSGIDGTGYGIVPGSSDPPKKILVAYGIYGDPQRTDNDHQVFLQYDPEVFSRYGQPLNQEAPHHSGPDAPESKYFLYTGNTTWGVQNLEYDPFRNTWLVAVYLGKKEQFTNFPMFLIDGAVAPFLQPLRGRPGESGMVLTLSDMGQEGLGGIHGSHFPLGSTGVCSLGDGRFYFSNPVKSDDGESFSSEVGLYRMDPETELLFLPC